MNVVTCIVNALLLILLVPIVLGRAETGSNPQKLVSPSAYVQVPAAIRVKLQAHSCRLPETQSLDNGRERINVVSGHFGRKDQIDWAAVCVINDRPQIFVIWQGSRAACLAEIHSGWPLEENFSAAGGIFLRKATPRRILNYRRAFPEGAKPVITHDGLEVGDEQASLIFYCDDGKWLELRGND